MGHTPPLHASVITVPDRCSTGIAQDVSGPRAVELLGPSRHCRGPPPRPRQDRSHSTGDLRGSRLRCALRRCHIATRRRCSRRQHPRVALRGSRRHQGDQPARPPRYAADAQAWSRLPLRACAVSSGDPSAEQLDWQNHADSVSGCWVMNGKLRAFVKSIADTRLAHWASQEIFEQAVPL